MRVKNLEFRRNANTGRSPEIVAFREYSPNFRPENAPDVKEYCYTLLFWRSTGSEGPSIEFVGARPLDFEERDALIEMMKYGQAVLDAEFKLMEKIQ